MREIWENFWWKWHYSTRILYGPGKQGWKTFRWQRLINIILIVAIILLFIVILKRF